MSDNIADKERSLLHFSTYDIFSYLVPGATFLYGLYLYGRLFQVNELKLLNLSY